MTRSGFKNVTDLNSEINVYSKKSYKKKYSFQTIRFSHPIRSFLSDHRHHLSSSPRKNDFMRAM